MADKETDRPVYHCTENRLKRSFGVEPRTGKNGLQVFTGELAGRAIGRGVLSTVFRWGGISTVAVLGSLGYGAWSNVEPQQDTNLTQGASQSYDYLVSRDVDNTFAIVRHGDDVRIYRIHQKSKDYRYIGSSNAEGTYTDVWDMIEDPAQARYVATRMTSSFNDALAALERGDHAVAAFAAPGRVQYDRITQAYEDGGQVFRESRHVAPTPVQGFELRTYLTQARDFWALTTARIDEGKYGFVAQADDVMHLRPETHYVTGVAQHVFPIALGGLAALVGAAALAGATTSTRRRCVKPK